MSSILTLPSFQDFSSRETDFHFCQFFFNFLKYFFSNFSLFHLYNIFTIYFSGNSSLLKSLLSAISNFSYCPTSVFNILSNFATTFFTFSKSFSFSQILYSTVNPFHHTKYFTTPLTFLFFSIFLLPTPLLLLPLLVSLLLSLYLFLILYYLTNIHN